MSDLVKNATGGIYVELRPDPGLEVCGMCGHQRRYHSSSGKVCCNGGCLCFSFEPVRVYLHLDRATALEVTT